MLLFGQASRKVHKLLLRAEATVRTVLICLNGQKILLHGHWCWYECLFMKNSNICKSTEKKRNGHIIFKRVNMSTINV